MDFVFWCLDGMYGCGGIMGGKDIGYVYEDFLLVRLVEFLDCGVCLLVILLMVLSLVVWWVMFVWWNLLLIFNWLILW